MGLPKVLVHVALSADGRTSGFEVDLELYYGLAQRWKEDATLTGADTLLAAGGLPADEAKGPGHEHPVDPRDKRPLLVVTDSQGRLRCWEALRHTEYWRSPVALVSRKTPRRALEHLRRQRVETLVCGGARVDLRQALTRLHDRHGVRRLRVDSGGALAGALLRAGLVHEVSLLVHPVLVGGTAPASFFRETVPGRAAEPLRARLVTARQITGGLLWLRYAVRPGKRGG
jgi:2,5-diamino-6-(ribosylamino)-4(3H)-pyrimidinone 5'-phosphate reductase